VRRNVAVVFFSAIAVALFLAIPFGLARYFSDDITAQPTGLFPGSETIITNFQSGHGFIMQSGTGAQTDDTEDYALGNQSMKLVTLGDGTAVFTRKSEISPALNFTDKLLKVWVKVNDTDNVAELRITITSDDFRTYTDYWIAGGMGADAGYLRNNRWNVVTLSPSHAASVGSSDDSRANAVQIRVADKGTGQPLALWINSISLVTRSDRPIVTFAFDDGHETDYTIARPVLDRYHFSATSYVITSMVGTPDRLSLAQLKNLQELNGWDIASHSYNHLNMTSLSYFQIGNELLLSRQFHINNGFQKGSEHFAYPYGEFDSDVLQQLVQKHYKTARTAEGPTETLPPSDPYRLRVMIVTNSTAPAEVSERVQSAITNGDWLVLVFHRIADLDDDQTAYRTADFATIVDDIASRGVDVMTVSEVYNSYR